MMFSPPVTGRYRILRADLDALQADGARKGDRDALDALRLGVSADSWPGLAAAERFAVDALYRQGVDWERLDPAAKASAVGAWIDGYRPAYADTYYDEERS